MGTVYILLLANKRFYIGSTGNLKRRLQEHNAGKTKSIRFLRPFELAFYQEYISLAEARRIEYRLKRLKSRLIIERIINDKLIKLGP